VGDTIKIQVGGNCVLRQEFDKPAVFCAGGIAISPFISMYRQHVQERGNIEGEGASFLYLVSSEDELVFVDELMELASTNGDRVVVSLTQQDEWKKPLEGVECLTGRDVMRKFLKNDTPNNAIYYICGPPSMLDEAIDLLDKKGVPSNNVVYEKWW
jgi:propane monooxygenase reductase subunit